MRDKLAFSVEEVAGPAKTEGPILTEPRQLVEANASVAGLVLMLSRRLGRAVDVEYRVGVEVLPTVVWAEVANRRSDE